MFVHCYTSESIHPFEGENNTNWTGVLINKQGKLQPNIQAKKILPTTNRAWREEQRSQTTMEIRNTKKIVWSALPHPLLKYKVSEICVTMYALYDHAWCHTEWSLWITAQKGNRRISVATNTLILYEFVANTLSHMNQLSWCSEPTQQCCNHSSPRPGKCITMRFSISDATRFQTNTGAHTLRNRTRKPEAVNIGTYRIKKHITTSDRAQRIMFREQPNRA